MRGMSRTKAHHPTQAQPITPEMLISMYQHLNHQDVMDVVIWSAILLAFFCFLRKSNYVSDNISSFDDKKQLLRREIKVGKGMLLVHIKWTKTIQFGGRSLEMPIVAIPENMLNTVKCSANSPAFSTSSRLCEPFVYSEF